MSQVLVGTSTEEHCLPVLEFLGWRNSCKLGMGSTAALHSGQQYFDCFSHGADGKSMLVALTTAEVISQI